LITSTELVTVVAVNATLKLADDAVAMNVLFAAAEVAAAGKPAKLVVLRVKPTRVLSAMALITVPEQE